MKPVQVKDKIYWVGAVDWDIRDFHGYSTDKGSTYNSYLLKDDDKTVLFDTVKEGFEGELYHRIFQTCKPEDIDWLVVNHLELDHSGSLRKVVERVKPEKIFTSVNGKKAMALHFPECKDWPVEVVKTGDSVKTGSKTIQFLETRMVHWPDSMFSYIPEEKLLISSDGFGHHWATSERFDDEVDPGEVMAHAAKYYANILLLYSPLIQKLLASVKEMGLAIDCIAPDHGVIWRSNPGRMLDAYDRWSRQETVNKAVVAYDTMWHSTEQMAHAVADGLIDEGMSVKLMNLAVTHRSDIMTEVLDAKAVVLGSATLNNGMLPRMADMIQYMKGLKPTGRLGAAFGSYGWSGEAVKQMTGQLEDMKFQIVGQGVRSHYRPQHDDLHSCRELGQQVGQAMKAA